MGRLVFQPPIELNKDKSVNNTAIAHLPSDRIEQFFIQDEARHVHRQDAQVDYRKDYENLEFTDLDDLEGLDGVTNYSIKTFPQFGSYGCFTITKNGVSKSIVRIKF